ncbi:MAG TPA: ArsA-related P-loop ATPase [Acidimicrobiales bacterium]|jgi:CO dehydrogenase maturation factor|nr:ArsA-related P-loop ATPase [Acidimicrobiales bacterium]
MRVAFVGKGGAGKSAISGTFARMLARRGHDVLAIDSDPLPGMAFSLGLDRDDAPLPDEAIEDRAEGEEGPPYRLRAGLGAAEAVERYAVTAPDGVRFLQFGKIRTDPRALFRSQLAFRQIIRELPADRWDLVGDLPGGTRQAFTGWGRYAETYLIVVEPMAKSLLSARRLARLATDTEFPVRVAAVANKVSDDGDVELIERRTGLEVLAAVPLEPAFADAERAGRAPLDIVPDSAAVRAVSLLVDQVSQRALT